MEVDELRREERRSSVVERKALHERQSGRPREPREREARAVLSIVEERIRLGRHRVCPELGRRDSRQALGEEGRGVALDGLADRGGARLVGAHVGGARVFDRRRSGCPGRARDLACERVQAGFVRSDHDRGGDTHDADQRRDGLLQPDERVGDRGRMAVEQLKHRAPGTTGSAAARARRTPGSGARGALDVA